MKTECKTNKMGRMKSYAMAGALVLGGLLGGGCRTAYIPETMQDRRHAEVYETHRLDNYTRTKDLRTSAIKNLEGVVESQETDYSALGEKYSELAGNLERSNGLMRNALAGADVAVADLYDSHNGGTFLSNALTEEQQNKFVKASIDLDKVALAIYDKSDLRAEDIMDLESKAKKDGNKALLDKIKEFKENARKLKIRAYVQNALDLTEGNLDSKRLELEDVLERYATSAGYSEIAPKALEKALMRYSSDDAIDHIVEHLGRDETIDKDDAFRKHRYDLLSPTWRMERAGKIDGKEQDSIIWYVDSETAKRLDVRGKDGGLKKFGKGLAWFVVPLGPGYKACERLSHAGAADKLEDAVAKDNRNYEGEPERDLTGKTIQRAIFFRKGLTNNANVVGSKGAIMKDGTLRLIQQGGQVMLVVGIVNASSGGGGGGGSSGSSGGGSGGGGGGGGGGTTPGTPVDW